MADDPRTGSVCGEWRVRVLMFANSVAFENTGDCDHPARLEQSLRTRETFLEILADAADGR
jgi:hypothetical protein